MLSIRLLFVGLLKTFSPSVDSGAGNACSLLTSFRLTVHVMNDWIVNVLILHTFACVCFMYLCFRKLWVCELHCGDSKLIREKAGISRRLQWADIRTRTTTSPTATHRMFLKDKHTCMIKIWHCEDIQQSTMWSCCLLYYYINQNNSSRPSTMIYTDKYSNELIEWYVRNAFKWGVLLKCSHYKRYIVSRKCMGLERVFHWHAIWMCTSMWWVLRYSKYLHWIAKHPVGLFSFSHNNNNVLLNLICSCV